MKNEYWRFKTRARRKEEIKIYEKYLVIYISIKRLERSVISSFNGSVLRVTWLHDIRNSTGKKKYLNMAMFVSPIAGITNLGCYEPNLNI